MRYDAKVDQNQAEIIAALEAAGCSVANTSRLGDGFPDLVVARPGGLALPMEVKMPGKKLSKAERKWHDAWRGQVAIVYSVEDALKVMGL